MRRILVLLACVACLVSVGCASGVSPSAVSYGAAATYQAVEPEMRFGVTAEAKSALMIPADVAACLTTGAAKILIDATDTVRCLLNTVTPPVVVPVQRVQVAPAAATPCVPAAPLPKAVPPVRAPGCEPVACAGGACAVR